MARPQTYAAGTPRLSSCLPSRPVGSRKLARSVDANEQVELSFSSLQLSDVDVKDADGVALELRPLRLLAHDIRQARDAFAIGLEPMAPQWLIVASIGAVLSTSGVGWTAAWHRGSHRVAAVCAVGMNDCRLLRLGQDRRTWLLRPHLKILDRLAFAPLRDRYRIDAQLPVQRRERSLRSLYCSSDGVRGRRAPMTNLAHDASFHS